MPDTRIPAASVANIDALSIESIIDKIPYYRVAWAEFEDGSVGLTRITDDEWNLMCSQQRHQEQHDPLPKHYRDIEV